MASQDMGSRQMQVLTSGPVDESPSIAPNGKLILYANESGGRGILAAVSSDGRVKQRLVAPPRDRPAHGQALLLRDGAGRAWYIARRFERRPRQAASRRPRRRCARTRVGPLCAI